MTRNVNWDRAVCCVLDGVQFVLDTQRAFIELDERLIETVMNAQLRIRIVRVDEMNTKIGIPVLRRRGPTKRKRDQIRPLRNIGPASQAVVEGCEFGEAEPGELRWDWQHAFGLDSRVVSECRQIRHQSGGSIRIGRAQRWKIRRLPRGWRNWRWRSWIPWHGQSPPSIERRSFVCLEFLCRE